MTPGSALTRPIPRVSLGDVVYDRLLDALLAGEFSAGDELNEVLLATRFEVSRTPIREAIQRLVADGLVKTSRNRQSTVVQLSRTEIIETYEVREFLESGAARLAALLIRPQQLQELREVAERATPSRRSDWYVAEREFDGALHQTVAAASGNQRLLEEIARYGKLVQMVRRLVARRPERLELGHTEHLEILAALEARDPSRSQAAMGRHIASSLRFVLEDVPWESK